MYIKNPKYGNKIFLDNSISDYEVRLQEVIDKILSDESIIDYCRENALIKNKLQIFSYENQERILENCATYLLMGQYKENDIMTIYNIRKAQIMEIPASCSNTNAEDLMYGNVDSEEVTMSASPELVKGSEPDINPQMLSQEDIDRKEKKEKKKTLRYKNSRTFRLERLYSTPIIDTYRIKQVFYKDSDGKKKPLKNIMNQPVFDAVPHRVGGHKGLVDLSKKYVSKWCLVDTDNKFTFMDKQYVIDESVSQYAVGEDNNSSMDMVLCYYMPDEDRCYFFDQNVEPIDSLDISQV